MADQQAPNAAIPCAAGCGFFGRVETENLCSKCYADRQKDGDAASGDATAMASSNSAATPKPVNVQLPAPALEPARAVAAAVSAPAAVPEAPAAAVITEPTSKSDDAGALAVSSDGTPKKKKKKRCAVCNVKLGMFGFDCRCEGLFCSKHRFPDDHECSFDHKSFDRKNLAEANQKVESEKLNRL